MERVAFLVEETNERLRCLVNPEELVFRRTAGLRPTGSGPGALSGSAEDHDRLVYTGGGRTELDLALLFDVSLAQGSSVRSPDVRALTAPIWSLAHNRREAGFGRSGQLPLARFVWGKHWNIRGVVEAVAERLEQFDTSGIPRRSWLRLRMLQVPESDEQKGRTGARRDPLKALKNLETRSAPPQGAARTRVHRVSNIGDQQVERIDQLAQRYYGDPGLWRLIASANQLDDPLRLQAGMLLDIPPLPDS